MMKLQIGIVLLVAVVSVNAYAQQEKLWKTMEQVSFNFKSPVSVDSGAKARKLASDVWGNTIKRGYPSFVLISNIETKDRIYTFTSLSAGLAYYPLCEDATNGVEAMNSFTKCPMRVIVEDKATKKVRYEDFADFCHLYVFGDADQPRNKNYAQVVIDGEYAKFRLVENGKQIDSCDRSLKLPK